MVYKINIIIIIIIIITNEEVIVVFSPKTTRTRYLGFIFYEHLTFSDQIYAVFKSCYYHVRELRCIRPYLDFKTASIATSVVYSKLRFTVGLL